jgi:peptidoglycan hydrolase-like protein with peptidoglycan-binding domain
MKRIFSLVAAGVLAAAVSASGVAAQSTAPAKTPSSSMQHKQRTTTVKSSTQDTTATASKHVAKSKWTKDQIKQAQEGLEKAGYFKGTPNGVYGRRTRTAIKKYQKANKLPVTGQLSDSLLTRLSSS